MSAVWHVLARVWVCGCVGGISLARGAADSRLESFNGQEQVCCSVILWVFRRHGATEGKALLPISAVLCVRAVDAAAAELDAR